MDWTQVLTIAGTNLALFLYATRQARTDYLHLDKKLEDNRKELNQIVKTMQEDNNDFLRKLLKTQENRY